MSLEAWGDEGDVPQRWEETAMRHELDEIAHRLGRWAVKYERDVPNDDVAAAIQVVRDTLDGLQEALSGRI